MRLLVADDDEDNRTVLVNILRGLGHDVREAIDGLAAIEQILADPPEMLITDFRMPRLDGVTLLEECRRQKLHFPVILMSSQATLLERERIALDDCCATLMMKPFSLAALKKVVEAAIARDHHRDCVHSRHSAMRS